MVASDVEPSKFDEETTKRMRKGYWLTGFGTGPDTVMLAIWSIGMLNTAATDSVCNTFNGYSSGADGSSCTADDAWNDTLWKEGGGTSCVQTLLFGDEKYVHDTSLAGCSGALVAYRAATSYTCNCTGDHAYTALLGWRPYNVVIYSLTAISVALAIVGLILGALLDYSSKRLTIWKALYALGCSSTFGMALVFPGGTWIIALCFHVLTHTFTELSLIPRSSYINYIAFDDSERNSIAGMRQYTSFAAQTIFLIVCLPLSLFLDSNIASCAVAGLCAIWYGVFMW